MSNSRTKIYTPIEEHIIQAGFNHFDAKTGAEYAQLGFALDALRTRHIPIAFIFGTTNLLTRDERMSIEMILENVLRRKLVSLGRTETVVEAINKHLEESPSSSSSSKKK